MSTQVETTFVLDLRPSILGYGLNRVRLETSNRWYMPDEIEKRFPSLWETFKLDGITITRMGWTFTNRDTIAAIKRDMPQRGYFRFTMTMPMWERCGWKPTVVPTVPVFYPDWDNCYSISGKADDEDEYSSNTTYLDTFEWEGKHYYSVTIDCETGHFVDTLGTSVGPYDDEDTALREAVWTALEWFNWNDSPISGWSSRLNRIMKEAGYEQVP